jgi:hypothetical protein
MEGIDWKTTETHTEPEGSGALGSINTAGPYVVRRGPGNIYKNSTRQNRLEWRC